VGAGFGGLECAKALSSMPVDVLLVDRNNYFLFTPLLYQVASSLLNPSDIAYPVRRVFRSSPNVRFRREEIVGVDFDGRTLATADGEALAYDWLVLATGSTTNFFGNAAVEKSSLGLKTLGEALQLRNHILLCLEEASQLDDLEAQRPWMTFVIVGGGPTGVEFAGALSELMRLVLAREYPTIMAEPRIVLVEGRHRLLGPFPERLGAYTARRLEKLGVEVMLDRLVKSADDSTVHLSDGSNLQARTLVWSAGVKPEELAELGEVPRAARSRRIEVDDHLRVAGHDNVFAIGDIAAAMHEGAELPMMSPPAMQAGRYVAHYIVEHLGSSSAVSPPFAFVDKGMMATIGRNAAVCVLRGNTFTGFLAWLIWLVVHIYYLIGYRNRLAVLWSWAWNYIWYDRPVRIITRAAPEPLLGPPSRHS
jgi:NADH dehydrogenase